MSLLHLWNLSQEQLINKHVQQLIAISGEGKLADGNNCSQEFRKFLSSVSSSMLKRFTDECLIEPFQDSGFALQDIVNEIGSRLGASVTPGKYRGTKGSIGNDGLWSFPNHHAIVLEVKTTDAYSININNIAAYRKALIDKHDIQEDFSSILMVVGRQDTGNLESQIRGSREAWNVRLISVDALMRLLFIKEELEDPKIIQQIHNILIPREFTRLDEIADILFFTKEDIKAEVKPVEEGILVESKEPKFIPVAFHEACIVRIQDKLKCTLIKRSRAQFASPDQSITVNCAVSKEHNPDDHPNYWFAFHPHQKESLNQGKEGFVAFGCGSPERVLLIPFNEFLPWLDGCWTTEEGERFYWHIVIYRDVDQYTLRRKKGIDHINLSKYLI